MHVINQRLHQIVQAEARARASGAGPQAMDPAAPDRGGIQPCGYEHEAHRRWQLNPTDALFERLRTNMRKNGLLVVARAQWLRWFGTEGPYA